MFFFQAEDGIRDYKVTGVQTCALPILSVLMPALDQAVIARRGEIVAALSAIAPGEGVIAAERAMRPFESDGLTAYRSAERRVGKEKPNRRPSRYNRIFSGRKMTVCSAV